MHSNVPATSPAKEPSHEFLFELLCDSVNPEMPRGVGRYHRKKVVFQNLQSDPLLYPVLPCSKRCFSLLMRKKANLLIKKAQSGRLYRLHNVTSYRITLYSR